MSDPTAVLLIDHDTCLLIPAGDQDVALTLIAVASEDPQSWDDFAQFWPRYRNPQVPEFADGLPLRRLGRGEGVAALADQPFWIVIDLVEKRILTNPEFPKIGRDECFAMVEDDKGNQHCPMSIHLPSWWEVHAQVSLAVVDLPRQTPITVPHVDRTVLFGQPLIDDLATRILATVQGEAWQTAGAESDASARYEFTKAVHRDWLMTPRDDLDGKMPRQILHGGREWISQLSWGQQLRFQDGLPIVAAPDSWAGYETASMGLEEMAIYFDLVRELISAGWFWCGDAAGLALISSESSDVQRQRLSEFLCDAKEDWLQNPFEGGSPPQFIIECSRRRVPRGAGVQIIGMDGRESEQHLADCDCPICEMMADGLMGVGFTSIDGHHLDLDNEFAFSTCETLAEWEAPQREYAEFAAEMNRKEAERQAAGEREEDDFVSAWTSPTSDQPLPGDPLGQMKLAFLLAEVIGELEQADAANDEIKELNRHFRAYRMSDHDELATTGRQLGEHLESLGGRYPKLTSRVADFRSRIDEQLRESAHDPL